MAASTLLDYLPCEACDGEGYYIYVGGPSYFDAGFGNWLPTERQVECTECCGTGWLEREEDTELSLEEAA